MNPHTEDSEGWEEKAREDWHVRSVNMAQEVTDYSKVEGLIADFWINKLKSLLAQREAEVRERIEAQRRKPNDKTYKTDDGGISNYDGPAYYFNKGLDAALATLSDKPSV